MGGILLCLGPVRYFHFAPTAAPFARRESQGTYPLAKVRITLSTGSYVTYPSCTVIL